MADSLPLHVYQQKKIDTKIDAVRPAIQNSRFVRIGLRGIRFLSGNKAGNALVTVMGLRRMVRWTSRKAISLRNNTLDTALAVDRYDRYEKKIHDMSSGSKNQHDKTLGQLRAHMHDAALADANMDQALGRATSTQEEQKSPATLGSVEENRAEDVAGNYLIPLDHIIILDKDLNRIVEPDKGESSYFLTLDAYISQLRSYSDMSEYERQQEITRLEESKTDPNNAAKTPFINANIYAVHYSDDIIAAYELAAHHIANDSSGTITNVAHPNLAMYFDHNLRTQQRFQKEEDRDALRIVPLYPVQIHQHDISFSALREVVKVRTFDEFDAYLAFYEEADEQEFAAKLAQDTALTEAQRSVMLPSDAQRATEYFNALTYMANNAGLIRALMGEANEINEETISPEDVTYAKTVALLLPSLQGDASFFLEPVENTLKEEQGALHKVLFNKSIDKLTGGTGLLEDALHLNPATMTENANAIQATIEDMFPLFDKNYQKQLLAEAKAIQEFATHQESLCQALDNVDPIDLDTLSNLDNEALKDIIGNTGLVNVTLMLLQGKYQERSINISELMQAYHHDIAANQRIAESQLADDTIGIAAKKELPPYPFDVTIKDKQEKLSAKQQELAAEQERLAAEQQALEDEKQRQLKEWEDVNRNVARKAFHNHFNPSPLPPEAFNRLIVDAQGKLHDKLVENEQLQAKKQFFVELHRTILCLPAPPSEKDTLETDKTGPDQERHVMHHKTIQPKTNPSFIDNTESLVTSDPYAFTEPVATGGTFKVTYNVVPTRKP